jgi:PadR family transcriptional regulator PadR
MTGKTDPNGLLHGTLDALVLKTLARGPRHGYGIARLIEEETEDAVAVEEGSLYPALYRMQRREWIAAEWGTSELGRRAKFYRITALGRRQLLEETQQWARFAAGVSKMLLSGR